MAKKKPMLNGLDELFMDNSIDADESVSTIRVSMIEPNKSQPRHQFDQSALNDLADSIAKHGVLQPILVRPLDNGGYQIVAGERRWRASRIAGLTEVPCLIKELSDKETMQLALIENLQREDLNPVEEALGYENLMSEYEMTQAEVAEIMGKSRSAVANSLRLLSLDDEVRKLLSDGKISAGHAKVLAGLDKDIQLTTAQRVVEEDLSVRELERFSQEGAGEKQDAKKPDRDVKRNTFYKEAEIALANVISKKVRVNHHKNGKITVEVTLDSDKDLTDFMSNFKD